jgi:hypothetical protein
VKQCNKCKELKSFDSFAKDSNRPSGYQSRCRPCDYEAHKQWRLNKFGPPQPRQTKYKSEEERRNARIESKRNRALNMTDDQRKKERVARNKRDAIKMNDPMIRLKRNIKSIALNGFKKGYSIDAMPFHLFGCSHSELINHIQSQFEPWMTWNNRGFGIRGEAKQNYHWQLDHIKPLSSAGTIDEYKSLWNYKNIRPLCAYVNGTIKKHHLDPQPPNEISTHAPQTTGSIFLTSARNQF